MRRRLPTAALLLGLAGLVPFIAAALGTLRATDAAQAMRFLGALIAYGAVILAFLGGVHWGFVLDGPAADAGAAPPRERTRLVAGVVPALVGWVALLVLLLLDLPEVSLAILLAGFAAFTLTEAALTRQGLAPAGYMWLRWLLSIVVVLLLATVLTLRLVGARITF